MISETVLGYTNRWLFEVLVLSALTIVIKKNTPVVEKTQPKVWQSNSNQTISNIVRVSKVIGVDQFFNLKFVKRILKLLFDKIAF